MKANNQIIEKIKSRKNPLAITFFSAPIMFLAFCALLYVKCFTEQGITLSWFWVAAPFWIPWAFAIAFFIAWYLLAILCFFVGYSILGFTMLCEWIIKNIKKLFKHD